MKVGVEEFLTDIDISSSPNPFSNSTTINYSIDSPAQVRIHVYDNLGAKISTLIDELQDAGEQRAVFDGSNLAQGVYYYTLKIAEQVISGKMVLVR